MCVIDGSSACLFPACRGMNSIGGVENLIKSFDFLCAGNNIIPIARRISSLSLLFDYIIMYIDYFPK